MGSLLNEGENSWQQIQSGNYHVTSTASGFTFACGLALRERLSGRGFACTARMGISTRRLWMTAADERWLRRVRSTRIRARNSRAAATVIGKKIAERTRAAGIEQVVFDRGGYMYHGRVEALAAAAREAGLKF